MVTAMRLHHHRHGVSWVAACWAWVAGWLRFASKTLLEDYSSGCVADIMCAGRARQLDVMEQHNCLA
jgi:hypothetical protein